MLNKMKNDYVSWIVITGVILLLLEVSFFNEGLIFSLLASGAMIYFGRSLMPKKSGKVLFWAGLFFFLSSVFSMMTFRFFLLAVLIYLVYQYIQSKKKPELITPVLQKPEKEVSKEMVIEKPPLFKNRLFGHQETPSHVYEWDDVNIQTGIGDSVIDLSMTVLPKGETVIFIRNIIGNVKVYVPYDVEVTLRHSSIVGSAEVFGHQEGRVLNQSLYVQTPGYEEAGQKVKIFTSMIVGNIEVKRI
ncbi:MULTISPECIES: cell wall-active antibiotics response protein LiaF [Bacillaceae]|uniref:cell wall-active antibiotics response protein LiaF n=1 Tax=Bacillaceae TaxID=186817 RepID=UPI0016424A84|nr:cell wall-active antibiotics response protein LiaF [Cytobacillus oceanisediminis]MCM3125461.1 cell wall-active antibiotics response protein LiaF [Mesobacillus sp. MER 33]MCM3234495.1 cell wall-active antibiotics response protein LiaF [Mesobacillus sp. MER 48]